MKKVFYFNGKEFVTSSFSGFGHYCVGVTKSNGNIGIINTNSKKHVLIFDREEWDVFIKGVKAGEFDYEKL